jgi:hypothetical protein
VPLEHFIELGLVIFPCCLPIYLIKLGSLALAVLAARVANPYYAVEVTPAGKYLPITQQHYIPILHVKERLVFVVVSVLREFEKFEFLTI